MVAYGPGDSRLGHTPHERLAAADYRPAKAILRDAVTAWARVAAGQACVVSDRRPAEVATQAPVY